jgi:hypothetical protein
MFLKNVVLVLLLANLVYGAYSLGWLNTLTGGDNRQREPERLQRQINAEMIDVQLAEATIAPVIAANCPPPSATSEQWIIYMGPYPTTAKRDAKMAELARLQINAEPVAKPSLKIGFSLGRFSDEASATQALSLLSQKGVQTAKIVLWQAASSASPTNAACN